MSRILLVEDEESSRLLYRNRLEDLGHQVVLASTGAMGLMEARAHDFDLFLLDVSLGSGISGFEVCQRLKSIPKTRRVPVIIISAQVRGRDDLSRGYEAGCDAFLVKGDLNNLEDVVRAHLRMKSLTDELSSQNALLEQQMRRLQQADTTAPAAGLGASGSNPAQPGTVGAARPDGTLLVGRDGVVIACDLGARALFGQRLVGLHLATLAPKSRLEALVRDVESEVHEGVRFDARMDGGWSARRLVATVIPTVPSKSTLNEGTCIVLLYDADRFDARQLAGANAEDALHPSELGPIREAARRSWNPGAILGNDPQIAQVRRSVAEFSQANAPVLIDGSEGTGGDFTARCLHYATPWSGRLLAVRLGSLAEKQMRNELFGGERSGVALTGAFAASQGGSVYLDGLEELPMNVQEELAEALESRSFVAAEGGERQSLEARIIGSIAGEPKSLVGKGVLSERLLSAFGARRLHLPDLCERLDDIPLLVHHFARRFTTTEVPKFSSEVIWGLRKHDWPRNVRELKEVVLNMLEDADSTEIGPKDLPAWLRDLAQGAPANLPQTDIPYATAPAPQMGSHKDWDISLDAYEKKALEAALDEAKGDRLEAARILGIGKSTLYRKLKKHEIA